MLLLNDADLDLKAANYHSFEDQFLENSIESNLKKLISKLSVVKHPAIVVTYNSAKIKIYFLNFFLILGLRLQRCSTYTKIFRKPGFVFST